MGNSSRRRRVNFDDKLRGSSQKAWLPLSARRRGDLLDLAKAADKADDRILELQRKDL